MRNLKAICVKCWKELEYIGIRRYDDVYYHEYKCPTCNANIVSEAEPGSKII